MTLEQLPDELRDVEATELAGLEPGDYLMVVTKPDTWSDEQSHAASTALNQFLEPLASRGIHIRPIWKPPEIKVSLYRVEEKP